MRLRPCERGRAIEQAKRKAQRYQPVTDVHVSSSSGSFILLRLSLPNQQQLYSQGARHLITVGKAGAANVPLCTVKRISRGPENQTLTDVFEQQEAGPSRRTDNELPCCARVAGSDWQGFVS